MTRVRAVRYCFRKKLRELKTTKAHISRSILSFQRGLALSDSSARISNGYSVQGRPARSLRGGESFRIPATSTKEVFLIFHTDFFNRSVSTVSTYKIKGRVLSAESSMVS